MFQLAKNGTSSFLTVFLFAFAVTDQGNSAFKTIIIEDTHLTLGAIPFKVEANNSNFFVITNVREKICQVSAPLVYNSLYKAAIVRARHWLCIARQLLDGAIKYCLLKYFFWVNNSTNMQALYSCCCSQMVRNKILPNYPNEYKHYI